MRPVIKTTKTPEAPAPTGLPKPQGATQEENARKRAEKFVRLFENQLSVFHQMQHEWGANHPEAKAALGHVKTQEDEVDSCCAKAKSAVSAAKTTIGDFRAKRKFRSAHYDSEEVARVSRQSSDVEQVLLMLIRDGVVTNITLDNQSALAWFAQRPQYSQMFHSAYRPKEEMTTAVTVPKYK